MLVCRDQVEELDPFSPVSADVFRAGTVVGGEPNWLELISVIRSVFPISV
jgi:hypothetical protein